MNLPLADVDFTKQKLRSARRLVSRIRASDFPYREPEAAIELLDRVYEENLARLGQITEFTLDSVRKEACVHANASISRFKKILGFILRSTNVRNSFEAYFPISRLAKRLLGKDANLILSSEWMFSPFTYPPVFKELPNYVLIGLPASESDNALILPLAGHELGHSIWRSTSISDEISKILQSRVVLEFYENWDEFEAVFDIRGKQKREDLVKDLFLFEIWQLSFRMAKSQAEEIFCDFIGARLFGSSFLYSFLYLIAPSLGGARSIFYPSQNDRVKLLSEFSKSLSLEVPENFESYFSEPTLQMSNKDLFLLRMADSSVEKISDELGRAAKSLIGRKKIRIPKSEHGDEIYSQFLNMTPAPEAEYLADVVNAGWRVRMDLSVWDKYGLDDDSKIEILNDLIFKSIEVMEFNKKTS